jgi:menaquinone-dependent protoporphyrinogen oxidase
MDKKVLVAHASKYGGSAEITERIGKVLRDAGLQVDVCSVKKSDPSAYGAVVLGSGVYIGQWRKEAGEFLKKYEKVLAGIPVWVFSSGPTGPGDPAELLKGWKYPPNQKDIIERIKPRGIAVFGGVLDENKMNFIEKQMIKGVKAPIGDFRDWKAIEAWAAGIAAELKK